MPVPDFQLLCGVSGPGRKSLGFEQRNESPTGTQCFARFRTGGRTCSKETARELYIASGIVERPKISYSESAQEFGALAVFRQETPGHQAG